MVSKAFRTMAGGLALLGILAAAPARGATVTQSFTLRPGWNAVFLEVEPPNTAPATVFAGISGLESVWTWNPRTSPVEFVQSPGSPLDPPANMLAYVPGSLEKRLSNLSAIHGEMPYLVKIAAAGPATQTWNVLNAQPLPPRIEWMPNSYNLVGFHVVDAGYANFGSFFQSSPAHADLAAYKAYRLDNATGTWVPVAATDPIMRGQSYWVHCAGSSTFAGPLAVQLETSSGLDFGSGLVEQTLIVRNASDAQFTSGVSVSAQATKVKYWKFDPQGISGMWSDLWTAPISQAIAAKTDQRLRLGVVRDGMTAGTLYESNVTITDGLGSRIVLPVKVRGVGAAGLWVGDAIVTKVDRSGSGSSLEQVGSPFGFRLIVHVDSGSPPTVRLLREVVQLWQAAGPGKPDPDNLGHLIPDPPGQFVLVVDKSKLGNFRGAALRDGQEVGRRISSAAFGFTGAITGSPNVALTGGFIGKNVTFTVNSPAADPLNPFLHQYHKDHTAAESYSVNRSITLDFRVDDASGNLVTGVPLLTWGSTEIGGVYSETLYLKRAAGDQYDYAVKVEGTFRLRKVSDVGQLQL